MADRKILITAALPYANGKLHFGHIAGVFLPADVFARFCRFRGDEVLFISGSDEYGLAVAIAAEMAGRSVEEHVAMYHAMNTTVLQRLRISTDHFSSTRNPYHEPLVCSIFSSLASNGFIFAEEGDHLYSVKGGRFLADRYVQGRCPFCGFQEARGDECTRCSASYEATALLNPVSKIGGEPLEQRKSTHYFLKLDTLKEDLAHWLSFKSHWRPGVINFLQSLLQELRARAITRDTAWGVSVPFHEIFGDQNISGKAFYVWFEAPLGYISISMEWAEKIGDPDKWKSFWLDEEVRFVQFLGKDNVFFHGILFPGMLLGGKTAYKLVDEMPVNQFYTLEGHKISKTEGWTVDIDDALASYSAEQLRYMFAATAPELSDADFKWADFQNKCNVDLVGKLGNFVNRTLTLLHKYLSGLVPEAEGFTEEDDLALGKAKVLLQEMAEAYDSHRLRRATQILMECSHVANTYFDAMQPWKLVTEQGNGGRLRTVFFCCLDFIRILAIAAYPLLPETAEEMWRMIGGSGHIGDKTWSERSEKSVISGSICAPPQILFRKISDEQIEKEMQALMPNEQIVQEKHLVSFEEFSKLDFRVGKILEVHVVPRSVKLLLLRVDIGEEILQILSGIAQYHNANTLIGKKVVVLVNLKPVRLMGLRSEGMILAVDLPEGVELLALDQADIGAKVR